jgi:hypothetical protein
LADYFTFRYDSDNVLWLQYDGPYTASIYWPTPGIDVYTSSRTNYNSSRIGVLDDTGAFVSNDGLCFQAFDLGAPGVQRWLTIDPDGNLRLYSLMNATGGWTASWVEPAMLRARAVWQERGMRILAVPPMLVHPTAP